MKTALRGGQSLEYNKTIFTFWLLKKNALFGLLRARTKDVSSFKVAFQLPPIYSELYYGVVSLMSSEFLKFV